MPLTQYQYAGNSTSGASIRLRQFAITYVSGTVVQYITVNELPTLSIDIISGPWVNAALDYTTVCTVQWHINSYWCRIYKLQWLAINWASNNNSTNVYVNAYRRITR